MIINNKENKEHFKDEICRAMLNASGCLAFVALQETNSKTHCEFKKISAIYDSLDNLWDYVNFCIKNDIIIDVSSFSYDLVRSVSELSVEDYKTYYKNYGEFCFYYV